METTQVYSLDVFAKHAAACQQFPEALAKYVGKTHPHSNRSSHHRRNNWRRRNRGEKNWLLTRQKDVAHDTNIREIVTAHLNKMTLSNCNDITKQLIQLMKEKISTRDQLENVVEVVFTKAIMETVYGKAYTSLCKALFGCHVLDNDAKVSFRGLLLNRCQTQFQELTSTELTDENMNDKLLKDRIIGCMVFLANLYLKGLFPHQIIYSCFVDLNAKACGKFLYTIESMCTLLDVCGHKLLKDNSEYGTKCLKMLDELQNIKGLSAKSRFAIMDVVEKYE